MGKRSCQLTVSSSSSSSESFKMSMVTGVGTRRCGGMSTGTLVRAPSRMTGESEPDPLSCAET